MLTTLRQSQGLTHAQMASKVGVERSYYSRMEAGKRPFSLAHFAAVVNALALTDAQAMALLRELAAAGAPAAEPPPATTPAPTPRPHQEAA